ncbi:hypothetical protein FSP39_008337 [Pinctada imbricata]|uniref:Uncharacterized protein n=1 Tax=Pinctada imbricata TaxID=66713 RepID=A0AA88XYK0_PINIB|nr:hypothetical protein FSP39_008337 [Pinctada imbricata]
MYYPTPPATLWTILLPLLMDFEEVFKTFKGVLVERYMFCKHCLNPSFLGEWNTPKETQNIKNGQKTCEACGEVVDIDTLVQQREERRDDVLEKLGEMRRRRKDALTKGKTLHQLLDSDDSEQVVTSLPSGRRGRATILPIPDLAMLSNLQHLQQGSGDDDDENDDENADEEEEENDNEENELLASVLKFRKERKQLEISNESVDDIEDELEEDVT